MSDIIRITLLPLWEHFNEIQVRTVIKVSTRLSLVINFKMKVTSENKVECIQSIVIEVTVSKNTQHAW